jgi:hypothetical protein
MNATISCRSHLHVNSHQDELGGKFKLSRFKQYWAEFVSRCLLLLIAYNILGYTFALIDSCTSRTDTHAFAIRQVDSSYIVHASDHTTRRTILSRLMPSQCQQDPYSEKAPAIPLPTLQANCRQIANRNWFHSTRNANPIVSRSIFGIPPSLITRHFRDRPVPGQGLQPRGPGSGKTMISETKIQ